MLIVLRIDGAGKSTQLKAMETYFTEGGKPFNTCIFAIRHTCFWYAHRKILRGKGGNEAVDPYLVALLFAW